MGMYQICTYERFSMTNVEKFEKRLKNWCNTACMHGKSMIIFDITSLKVGEEPQKFEDDSGEYYKVTLPNISFIYTRVADSAMCVMYKIWENRTQSVIYRLPSKWDSTELWLGV